LENYDYDYIIIGSGFGGSVSALLFAEQDHTANLILHGLLHLAGFDHILDDEAAEMEKLESYLLTEIGIADPYQDVIYTSVEARDNNL